jgi:hypothetical protein
MQKSKAFTLVAVVLGLSLGACAPKIMGGNERSVMMGTVGWDNADKAFAMADAHCRKYGRVARLAVMDSWSQQASYDCIEGDPPKR